jgi:hypothetical protein
MTPRLDSEGIVAPPPEQVLPIRRMDLPAEARRRLWVVVRADALRLLAAAPCAASTRDGAQIIGIAPDYYVTIERLAAEGSDRDEARALGVRPRRAEQSWTPARRRTHKTVREALRRLARRHAALFATTEPTSP